MKRTFKVILFGIAIALMIAITPPNLRANTVDWNAQATALTLADLVTLDPATNLIMMGYFKTNDAVVISLATSPLTLSSYFVPVSTSTVGKFGANQLAVPGLWGASISTNFETLGITSTNIYVWAFNALTITNATQQGIFKFANTFPTELASPLQIDLTNLFTGGSVLWGSTNQGAGNVSTALGSRPHINLALIPEPSAFVLVGLGLAGMLVVVRRRRR